MYTYPFFKKIGCLCTFWYAVKSNNYKRRKPPEHIISFVGPIASVHFVRKYLIRLLLLLLLLLMLLLL